MILPLLACCVFFVCCNNHKEKTSEKTPAADTTSKEEKPSFFPVTSYILGQMTEINEKSINPIQYTTIKNHTDSVFLKVEDLPKAFSEFLHPEIDSTNLVSLFMEKRFMDQSIDAFTFTYDPIATLPDSMNLQHWDVYIDPKSSKVKRIYMLKNFGETKTMQLTWQGDKWCKIVQISNKPDGSSTVDKEVKITWDY